MSDRSGGRRSPDADGGRRARRSRSRSRCSRRWRRRRHRSSLRKSRRDLGVAPKLIGVFVGLVYAGIDGGEPRLRRIHRALRRDPRVAGVRDDVRRRRIARAGAMAVPAMLVPVLVGRAALRHRTGLRADHAGILAGARAHRATVADGAHVLDQADRRAGRRGAGRCAAAGIVALALGWRAAFVLVATSGIVIALVAQTARASLDAERIPARSLNVAGVFAPLARVLATPALRRAGTHRVHLRGAAGVPDELPGRLPHGDAVATRSSPRASR